MSFLEQLPLANDPPGGDSGRFLWFAAIAIILAIQHFVEKAREKRAAKEMLEHPFDEEDVDYDWEEEAGEQDYAEVQTKKESLVEFFREAAALTVATPPTPPVPAERPKTALPPARTAPQLSKAEEEALARIAKSGGRTALTQTNRQRMHNSRQHTALGAMLRDPASLRNAFILKEILDPPVASREEQA